MSISTIIKSVQDIMRQDAGVDGDAQRISQLGWMIFMKIFDDREEEFKLQNENYESPIPERLRWRSWAANDEGITGDELLDFVNDDLFKTMKEPVDESDADKLGNIVRGVFADSYNYMKSGTLIRQVVNRINQINFNDMEDRHVFNDIYEKILRDLQSAGNAGEYYTPRPVTQFMADMVDPKLGEVVFDPACGTGGFLVCALENMRKQATNADDFEILRQSVKGIEKKPLPHMLCITNLMLHDIEVPLVDRKNSLSVRPYRDYSDADRVDCILTNPPFGGMEEPGIETNFPKAYQTRETADLFLVLIMRLLRDGGRGAIVLPVPFLFGEGVKTRIKERLLSDFNLHTIVRLPDGVFSPYTDIQTNLLFFTKGEPTEEIWYFEHPLPEGYKKYTKTRPIRHEEFELEKSWWHDREENEYAWRVSVKEIEEKNYRLDFDNPRKVMSEYGNPVTLSVSYQHGLQDMAETKDLLKQELQIAEENTILSDNFDSLLNSLDNISRLKSAILGLAVSGRLVSQDPNDEPASELLEKIKAEKQQLTKEKKIRKEKPLPPISEDEIPYGLPNGWKWVRLGEVRHDLGQKKPDKKFIYIDVSAINKEKGIISDEYQILEPTEAPSRARKLVQKGTVIYATVRPYLLNIAIVNEDYNPEPIVSTAFAIMHPYEGVFNRYLYYYLRSRPLIEYVEEQMVGMAYPAISDSKLFPAPFPLPPLNEQKRIVEKVDGLMRLCDKLETQLAQSKEESDKLMQAILQEAFQR